MQLCPDPSDKVDLAPFHLWSLAPSGLAKPYAAEPFNQHWLNPKWVDDTAAKYYSTERNRGKTHYA
jgi:hypothetical protein